MIVDLLKHPDYIRILLAVREEGKSRFSQIERELDLNPAQVDRALKFLCKGFFLLSRTVPVQKGPIIVEYSLSKRGVAFLESFDSFRATARRKTADLGASEVKELQGL